MSPHSRYERTISYMAKHRVAELAVYVAMGMASFVVFVLPLLVGVTWLADRDITLPYVPRDWLFWPTVLMRVSLVCGPSLLGMAFLLRWCNRRIEMPVKRMRLEAMGI